MSIFQYVVFRDYRSIFNNIVDKVRIDFLKKIKADFIL